jgi:hypothetical protein
MSLADSAGGSLMGWEDGALRPVYQMMKETWRTMRRAAAQERRTQKVLSGFGGRCGKDRYQ